MSPIVSAWQLSMPGILIPLRLEVGKLVFQCRDLCLAAGMHCPLHLSKLIMSTRRSKFHCTMDLHRNRSPPSLNLRVRSTLTAYRWSSYTLPQRSSSAHKISDTQWVLSERLEKIGLDS